MPSSPARRALYIAKNRAATGSPRSLAPDAGRMSGQHRLLRAPMCSWCYGFGPSSTRLMASARAARRLVMGGLRAYSTGGVTPGVPPLDRGTLVARRARVGTALRRRGPSPRASYDTERPAAPWSPCGDGCGRALPY